MAINSARRYTGLFSARYLLPAVTIVAALAVLPGCKKTVVSDPNDPKFIVAEKGTWFITREELNKEVADFLKQHQVTPEQVGPSKMPMVETLTLKNLVLKKLLLDKAATEKPADLEKQEQAEMDVVVSHVPPGEKLEDILTRAGLTIEELKKQIHEKVLVENVLQTEAFKNVEPTDQEIDKIYLANKDKFNIPEKVRVSRILIHVDPDMKADEKAAKKTAINQAHARVVKGEDFGAVAGEVSEDRGSSGKGGDLGWVPQGVSEPGFDEVAFKTKENTVSPVFLTPLGYQFVKVTAFQPAGVVPVADARNYISQQLRMQKMEVAAHDYTQKLMANSGVIYHLTLVDPPAQVAPQGPGGPPDQGAPPTDQGQPAGPDASAPPPPPQASEPAPPAAPPAK